MTSRLNLLSFWFLAFVAMQLSFYGAQAQRYNNNWYFGRNAGLNFNTSPPTPLTDGKLSTDEGSASISDANGNLLFYSDGLTIWNKNHQVMENGTGLFGHPSTTQAVIIAPTPGKTHSYHVFTQDYQGRPNGLRYSVVDLSRQNGLGEVVTKNELLQAPTTEMMAATLHANGRDIWVLAHELGTNHFIAFLLTSAGPIATPVISSIGPVYNPGNNGENAAGHIRFSLDGKKVAVSSTVSVDLYDFDPATGQLSNRRNISSVPKGYGAEFSPDGTKLYVSERSNFDIIQLDITAGTAEAISATATSLRANAIYALQLGPDHKIYAAGPTGLGVIEKPNEKGTASIYLARNVNLAGGISTLGLPSYVQSFFSSPANGITFSNTCFGDETQFTFHETSASQSPLSVRWDFGDPTSGSANSSTSLSTTHVFTAPGTYTVKLTRTFADKVEEHSIAVTILPVPVVNLGPDKFICPGSRTVLDATTPGATYRWSNGSTSPTITVGVAGTYWVDVFNANGCTSRDEVVVSLLPVPALELGPNRELCQGQTLLLDVTLPNVTYIWQDGSTNPTFTVTEPGTYEVTVTNQSGCSSTDAITIGFIPLPDIDLGPDRQLCEGEVLFLGSHTLPGATYRWQDGSTNAGFFPKQSGTYWQEITINGCTSRDEVNVIFTPPPTVNLGNDTTLCLGQTLALNAFQSDATYKWQDGSTQPIFMVSEPGTYWVEVTNALGCTGRDEILVYYLTPPSIELGSDTTLCSGDVLTVGQALPNVTYLWQDGSTGPTYAIKEPGTYRVTASLQHCSQTDAITVNFKNCVAGLFVPNIITPNGDGVNDTFFIHGLLKPNAGTTGEKWQLTLYDRWGKVQYQTDHYQNNWAAEGFSEGTYLYYLQHNQEGRTLKGWVEVVR